MIEWELRSIRILLVKFIPKIGQEKYLLSILFWKLILGLIILKILNGEKNNRKFLLKQILAEYFISELLSRTRQA